MIVARKDSNVYVTEDNKASWMKIPLGSEEAAVKVYEELQENDYSLEKLIIKHPEYFLWKQEQQ